MGKFEILSPAGDVNNFYEAIRAGADAVYLGLNKFNARMKADNFNIDNLAEMIRFAHLRGVKVYITLNTLLSDSEVREAVSLVGECLQVGVDAFIVQDYGIIGILKNVYPSIELHGSTQLGVHNRYGAMVAKSLGLSRVVLSREVTLDDIKDIKENVDIELEVFVQGAMCVAFSGNCYLSSLKHGASGNRGECKQLCRLPYLMQAGKKSINGYVLSPRDNCMLMHLKELCELGVVSFKIEGRLRRKGYVNIATRTYRHAIDVVQKEIGINDIGNEFTYRGNAEKFDLEKSTRELKKVFSRGEFISGYFDGNDIIDTTNNNHMGEKVGKVIACNRFKDIYKITIESSVELHSGDGLKFKYENDIVSLGVGNIDKIGNKYIVYGKNFIKSNCEVYRVLDIMFENTGEDVSRKRVLSLSISAIKGRPILARCKCGDVDIELQGAECMLAKSRPITEQNIIEQFSKGIEDFDVRFETITLDENVFLPLSELNALRRDIVRAVEDKILARSIEVFERKDIPLPTKLEEPQYNALAIVDEYVDMSHLKESYDALILSPKKYSREVVCEFERKYKKFFDTPLIINFPVIAMKQDLNVLDDIVSFVKDKKLTIMANNIYALYYLSQGVNVLAGSNMNITNSYAVATLKELGVDEFVASIEKWCNRVANTYKMCGGKRVLMTLAHCPHKTISHTSREMLECAPCVFKGDLKLSNEGGEYLIRRCQVGKCYFELVDTIESISNAEYRIDDLRG